VLTPEDIEILRTHPVAQTRLKLAAWMMRTFYESTDHWYAPGNHNHQRITRIIRSLRLLTTPDMAVWFYRYVTLFTEATPTPQARQHWQDAIYTM
jgi:hypothetical protein